jgi:hypothetical protein
MAEFPAPAGVHPCPALTAGTGIQGSRQAILNRENVKFVPKTGIQLEPSWMQADKNFGPNLNSQSGTQLSTKVIRSKSGITAYSLSLSGT